MARSRPQTASGKSWIEQHPVLITVVLCGVVLALTRLPGMAPVMGVLGAVIIAAGVAIVLLTVRPARRVSPSVEQQLHAIALVRRNQHKVSATLRDGTVVPGVYIARSRWVTFSFGRRPSLRPKDIISVSPPSS